MGDQLAEVFDIHRHMRKEERWEHAVELLRLVSIPDAEGKAHAYPYEMSGGQARRAMIAMSIALNTDLLIADEPTTALDVSIQAQILDLMLGLRNRLVTAVVLITHDLGLIAETADRVAVMYAGQVVEQPSVTNLFDRPLHPYTQGLINSIPVPGKARDCLDVIPGIVPSLIDLPPGCRFSPHCQACIDHDIKLCKQIEPTPKDMGGDHYLRYCLFQDYEGHVAPLKTSTGSQLLQ